MTASRELGECVVEEDEDGEGSRTPRAGSTQSMNSLLAQALEVPSLSHHPLDTTASTGDGSLPSQNHSLTMRDTNKDTVRTTTTTTTAAAPNHLHPTNGQYTTAENNNNNNNNNRFWSSSASSTPASSPSFESSILPEKHLYKSPSTTPQLLEHMIPVHSDYTIPTSNKYSANETKRVDFSVAPPLGISPPPALDHPPCRRSILGSSVGKRYHTVPPVATARTTRPVDIPQYLNSCLDMEGVDDADNADDAFFPPLLDPAFTNNHDKQLMLPTSTPESPPRISYIIHKVPIPHVSPLTPARQMQMTPQDPPTPRQLLHKTSTFHETIHAQSLLLGLAFMAVWSPNNAMAPNLTQMAEGFGMSEAQRDLYLGSYCALALGVFSLPISGSIGFMADFYPRKHLFVACVVGGSFASAWTGYSTTFLSLFAARLVSGGCMSASVPVAFSLLGDLFSTEERNAASSGLTAMMGLGIIIGQVYAGMVGPTDGWSAPFYVSSLLSLSTALLVALWVREPDRGAKEKALQGLLQSGSKYERRLTLTGFVHAMRHNRSNTILVWQGFFTSLPWGIVFCFLNDFLSQEKGFSVPDATFMVMLFGVGCAFGGILGGYIGQKCQEKNRSSLPLFMALTTFLGIVPFVGLLNSNFPNKHGYKAMGYSILGGCIASLPSVNARPCILNVNPPETRGAALTASNLLITLGRGIGPSCITVMGSLFHVSRQSSFNITLTLFWTITSIHLLFLAKTLPGDQDAMEEELTRYAAEAAAQGVGTKEDHHLGEAPKEAPDGGIEAILMTRGSLERNTSNNSSAMRILAEDGGGESIVSIEEYMTSFDGQAARRSIQFVQQGFKELRGEIASFGYGGCGPCGAMNGPSEEDKADEDSLEEILPQEELRKRRNLWKRQQHLLAQNMKRSSSIDEVPQSEETPLLGSAV